MEQADHRTINRFSIVKLQRLDRLPRDYYFDILYVSCQCVSYGICQRFNIGSFSFSRADGWANG